MKYLLVLMSVLTLNGGEMIAVRKSEERGHSDHGWLVSDFTFSFADYYDPNFMGFRTLRVMNEDIIEPTKGFDTHPHSDMEILTYIIDGTIEHKDTLGNKTQIRKGEFQIQSAGTGIEHSEYNPSKKEKVHLLQIWIKPEKKGLTPCYEQKSFADHKEGLRLAVSPEGKEALKIHQDARIYLGRYDSKSVEVPFKKDRHAWIQVTQGHLEVNGQPLDQGDGASMSKQESLSIKTKGPTEFLLFDLK